MPRRAGLNHALSGDRIPGLRRSSLGVRNTALGHRLRVPRHAGLNHALPGTGIPGLPRSTALPQHPGLRRNSPRSRNPALLQRP
ncbi:hypothetical protein [Streptomyces niveiscabiei]|uniref:hypothetical protein n=1 Tax=Streptomyces niveiscabiei TaxID=164115 RepID=UPI00389AF3A5